MKLSEQASRVIIDPKVAFRGSFDGTKLLKLFDRPRYYAIRFKYRNTRYDYPLNPLPVSSVQVIAKTPRGQLAKVKSGQVFFIGHARVLPNDIYQLNLVHARHMTHRGINGSLKYVHHKFSDDTYPDPQYSFLSDNLPIFVRHGQQLIPTHQFLTRDDTIMIQYDVAYMQIYSISHHLKRLDWLIRRLQHFVAYISEATRVRDQHQILLRTSRVAELLYSYEHNFNPAALGNVFFDYSQAHFDPNHLIRPIYGAFDMNAKNIHKCLAALLGKPVNQLTPSDTWSKFTDLHAIWLKVAPRSSQAALIPPKSVFKEIKSVIKQLLKLRKKAQAYARRRNRH